MNKEMIEALRSILKEELIPINKRFDIIERDFNDHKTGQEKVQRDLNEVKTGQEKFQRDLNEVKTGLNELKIGQEKLQKNLIESLGAYTEKIAEHVDHKTEALNKRVFAVETVIQRLTRQ